MTSSEATVQINIVVPGSLRDSLKLEAASQRRSMSEVIRYAIDATYPDLPTTIQEVTRRAGATS